MAIILDKYAIKEVADVMFYELDSKGAPSAPVLYLDTLKTSTLSQSSEVVDARGGKGNVKILSWDTNKELTIEMEDAVYSAKSLGIMFGGKMYVTGDKQEVLKTLRYKSSDITEVKTGSGSEEKKFLHFEVNGHSLYISEGLVTAFSYQNADGKEVSEPVAVAEPSWVERTVNGKKIPAGQNENGQQIEFITFDLLDCTSDAVTRSNDKAATTEVNEYNGVISGGVTIDIGAEFNSNTYYITGDTYARNVASGKDEFLQFIIPKGKVSAEDVSLTMEADGDPATFSMTVQCLKSESGSMVKLVKYNIGAGGTDAVGNKGVASVLDEFENNHDAWTDPRSIITEISQNEENLVFGD